MELLAKQFNYDDYRLNTEIENIIRRINLLQPRKPDYDSGWFNIAQGETITKTHNLNTNNMQIELQLKGVLGINHYSRGAYWRNLENNTIQVTREIDDVSANEVRIMMWKL